MTLNFKRPEFACKCGCGFDAIDPDLVNGLQWLRAEIGKPIVITSGCRCAKHNAAERGARGSMHLTGKAADVRVAGMSARQLYAAAREIPQLRGFGVDEERGFLHVDTRAVPARWCYTGGRQAPWREVLNG
jgi:uncharacterized protein YcbK (DUF882 family)